MKVRVKPKYEAGAATNYISRRQAMKKLQLSLKDFRRLCILKGIYPHEPAHKKQVNKGSTEQKVWYYRKDINFLDHEPIIQKFREYKVFIRKLNHYKGKKMDEKVDKLYKNKPEYSLDRVVKERFPTFGSAIRDLDDALCLCFIFATLPHTSIIKQELIESSRRLTAEFMHYVIESHSLVHTFISIKGIYYQAEICGEKVTWIVPHDRGTDHVSHVDFNIMVTFAEFYVAMLGFVNFRLYQMIGLYYPPQIQTGQNVTEKVEEDEEEHTEKVYSLSRPLAKRTDTEKDDDDETEAFGEDGNALAEKMKEAKTIRTLFKGCVFLLNREVPREALTLIIRNCGGTVGWQGGPSPLDESSKSVTHQVVDRPMTKFDVNKRYVQPQWIFDCLNARRKLPVEKYLPGSPLPPHFSPFSKEKPGDYVPIERLEELRNLGKDVAPLVEGAPVQPEVKPKKAKKPEEEKGMRVALGKMHKRNKQFELNQEGADMKLREMMIPKKHQRVYHSLKEGMKRTRKDGLKLKSKRIQAQKAASTDA